MSVERLRPNFERFSGHPDGVKRWADHGQRMREQRPAPWCARGLLRQPCRLVGVEALERRVPGRARGLHGARGRARRSRTSTAAVPPSPSRKTPSMNARRSPPRACRSSSETQVWRSIRRRGTTAAAGFPSHPSRNNLLRRPLSFRGVPADAPSITSASPVRPHRATGSRPDAAGGGVSGVARDEQGAVVPGVSVSATSPTVPGVYTAR